MSLFAELYAALRRHWPYYLAEAGGLAFFITGASILTLALEHPDSPAHQWLVAHGAGKLLRRIPLGLGMGLIIVVLVYNPWGKVGGAYQPCRNPGFLAVRQYARGRCVLVRSGPGSGWGSGGTVTKFGNGQLLRRCQRSFHHHHARAGRPGLAFAAEFVISFGLMWVLLLALHSRRLKPAAGWLLGGLLMVYIIGETPLSGMSLNPFRTLSAAIVAGNYSALWVYFLAPTAAMSLATALFQWFYLRPACPPTTAVPPQYPDLAAA
ncbi:MAG: aquaporin [Hymenobacter sp.]